VRTNDEGSGVDEFPHLKANAERLGASTSPLTPEETVELLCSDCPFYHPEREEELECGSFRILRRLIETGDLTPAQIVAACR
jgi:hypothetical protein